MASTRSGSICQSKPLNISQKLLDGEKFLKWTDQDNTGVPITLQLDKNGFFLYYFDQKDEVSLIDIFQIKDVRTGPMARTPKDPKVRSIVNLGQGQLEDKTITIVYGVDFCNVNFCNFCTHKVDTAQTWCSELWSYVRSLNPLSISSIQNLQKIHTQLLLLTKAEKPIPVRAIVKFFAQNREDRKVIERALDQSGFSSGRGDVIEKKYFGFEQFQVFYQKLLIRNEITEVFSKFCHSEPKTKVMTSKEFLSFLNNYQRDPRLNEILFPYASEEKALGLIKKYEPNQHLVSKNQLSGEGFMWFLLSEDNLVMSPERLFNLDKMDQPLSFYFIASSHNTYLTGHQITGRAGVEMYRQVLLSGCRCIELDFWNGEDEPHITHGYTMVNKLPARDVIQAIAECAFKTSDYPLVLSFENHCNPKQQAKIAQYCREHFGDKLLDEPLLDFPLKPGQVLPSPEILKGKIIIKNKKQHLHHPKSQHSPKPTSVTPTRQQNKPEASRDTPDTDNPGPAPAPGPLGVINGEFNDSETDSDSDSEEEEEDSTDSTGPVKAGPSVTNTDAGTAGKESKACAEISALVNYMMPVRFRSFEQAEKRRRAYEMSSFVETTALALLKSDPIKFVEYNKFQASRIYPRGTRFESSNYIPQIYWNAGCQLVALNYQTLDVPMQLNLGIFQYNRRTGYLLKPDFMCVDHRKFDPFTESSVDGIVPGTVSIKIISGQFLTDKKVGTYVEVEMYGLPRDTVRRGKYKTKTVQNGVNPIYDEEPFLFRQVILPDLAVFRIAAFEESGNKLIGHRVLPIVGLCPGYRHIPLFNESGQPLHLPNLFVFIEVKDYVPNAFSDLADALTNPIKHQSELERRNKQLAILADDLEGSETDNKSEPQSPVGTVGTPEAISPTGDKLDLIRTASKSAGKAVNSKDGSPIIGPQRTDSSTSLPIRIGENPAANSLKNKPFTPTSVDEILEQKPVKDRYTELDQKLEQLRKKKNKELGKIQDGKLTRAPSKPKNPLNKRSLNKIAKIFSKANLESTTSPSASPADDPEAKCENVKRLNAEKEINCERNYLQLETELREKYYESIFSCADKLLSKNQSSQLKTLEILHNTEASEVMKRLELDCRDSKEDDRERRERLIKRGVTERSKLQELYNDRKYDLEQSHKKVKEELKERLDTWKKELTEEHEASMAEIETRWQGAADSDQT